MDEMVYEGWVAERIVKTMKKYNGLISHEDLIAYKSVWRVSYEVNFRGISVTYYAATELWKYCSWANFTNDGNPKLDSMEHHSAAYYHLLTEAMRRAFADRAHYLGDLIFIRYPRRR